MCLTELYGIYTAHKTHQTCGNARYSVDILNPIISGKQTEKNGKEEYDQVANIWLPVPVNFHKHFWKLVQLSCSVQTSSRGNPEPHQSSKGMQDTCKNSNDANVCWQS